MCLPKSSPSLTEAIALLSYVQEGMSRTFHEILNKLTLSKGGHKSCKTLSFPWYSILNMGMMSGVTAAAL